MNDSSPIHILDDQLTTYVHPGCKLETWDSSCGFSEGPLWHPEGYYLFSDIPRNGIFSVGPGRAKELFLEGSGYNGGDPDVKEGMEGSNGLGWHPDGSLLICQHGNHTVAQWVQGRLQPFITHYEARPLNSPNDLVVRGDGTVFFSDPPYGLQEQRIREDRFQPRAGVYRWQEGNLALVTSELQYPNGVCLSPDGSTLYICSNKPSERKLLQYDADSLAFKSVLAEENGDGIECDPWGNLYLCSKEGIVILNPSGQRLGIIRLPSVAANLCWGGAEGRDLCITARENIFGIRNFLNAVA
ncbi:MAG TPA: SMP-30/gluconolactonase/LRE family protein [Chitinophagaceae bacterium]|jgi:gluconolactonase|nr:SMP-30/gluconolactonase/LRE family protein [Chitinophagaceae bacterium]